MPDDLAARRAKALQMRRAGAIWQDIADTLGYSTRGAACQDVTRALAEARGQVDVAAAEYRATELAKLDVLESEAIDVLLAVHPVVQGGAIVAGVTDAGPTLRAIDTLRRLAERRAKLLGIDAPEKMTIEAPITVRHVLAGIDVDQL